MNYWVIFVIFVPLGVFVFGRPLSVAYGDSVNMIKAFVWDVLGIGGFQSYNITWWFNKLILILYLLSPIVFIFTKQLPIFSILCVFLMQRLKILNGTYSLYMYLMPFVLGFVWAQNAEKISKKLNQVSKWVGVLLALILLGMTVYGRQTGFLISALEWDTYLAVAIMLLVLVCKPYRLKSDTLLGFLGKHSMNIYMIHTFVYYYFWRDEIYAFGSPWLILLVVTAITLAISFVIEFIKDKTHFYRLPDVLMQKYWRYERTS